MLERVAQRQAELQEPAPFLRAGVDLWAEARTEDLVLGREVLDLADEMAVEEAEQAEEKGLPGGRLLDKRCSRA